MESTPLIYLNLKLLEEPYHPNTFTTLDAAFFTSEGLAIALILILLTLHWKERKGS